MDYYRQGDICIIPVRKPGRQLTAVVRDGGRIVLQYGELTGHAHAVLEADAELFSPGEASQMAERYLRIGSGGAVVVHEEHAPIELPPGWYEVRRQREYEPQDIRLVAD